jgi:hypothetical protein
MYEINTELSGFAPAVRNNVRLDVNATLTSISVWPLPASRRR